MRNPSRIPKTYKAPGTSCINVMSCVTHNVGRSLQSESLFNVRRKQLRPALGFMQLTPESGLARQPGILFSIGS